MDDVTFLYPAKAAAGPCVRLARYGGRGFRMRACRLVVYYIIKDLIIYYSFIYLLIFSLIILSF
jgi:hypothetical protein